MTGPAVDGERRAAKSKADAAAHVFGIGELDNEVHILRFWKASLVRDVANHVPFWQLTAGSSLNCELYMTKATNPNSSFTPLYRRLRK